MPTIDVQTVWGSGSILTAKRTPWSYSTWASVHFDEVFRNGESTNPASGSGSPLTHTVVWTKDSETYTAEFTVYGTQQELDDAVNAYKNEVIAAGGTIVSG